MSFFYAKNKTDQCKIHSSQDKKQESDTFLVFLLNEQGKEGKEQLPDEEHSSQQAAARGTVPQQGQHHCSDTQPTAASLHIPLLRADWIK